jgi:AraC family transcriptional regulator, transcriptional activator FtrA
MHRVVAIAAPGTAAFELGIVTEIFGLLGGDRYELLVCAERPGPQAATAGGFAFVIEHGLEALMEADTVIVPGWPGPGPVSPAVLAAVRAAHDRGARVVSICSGAFVLAAAGLLDGREAATHWRYAERLSTEYPRVRVNADVLYVDAGRVLTSAGSSAGIDLCLHIVRSDHGSAAANAIARRLVMPPHRDGALAQVIELPMPAHRADDPIARVMQWALEHLAEPLPQERLARHAHLSVRAFSRRFRRATGTTPGRWLREQRLRASLALLEGSEHPVEEVAALVGFASASTFRHHFAARMGTSPSGHRRRYGCSAASSSAGGSTEAAESVTSMPASRP